jgi:hypothetical protein
MLEQIRKAWRAGCVTEPAPPTGPISEALGARLATERLYNHLGDVSAILNDTGYTFAHAHCGRLREDLLERVVADFEEVTKIALGNTLGLECLQGTGQLTRRTAEEMQVAD